MAPAVELPVDGLSYRGFAQMLYDVLDEVGVPTEQIEYVCQGEPGPDGLQGHIIVHLKVLASEFMLKLHAFEELQVETSVAACVQSVSCSALRRVMHDAHEYLKRGPYHLLPRALDLTQSTERQVLATD
jgi:hypothetical protein